MPRTKKNALQPGSYKLVVDINSKVVDPGSTISGSLYFSGYGEISGAKIFLRGDKQIFNHCEWFSGFHYDATQSDFVQQGVQPMKNMGPSALLLFTTQVRDSQTNDLLAEPFSDASASENNNHVLSETDSPKAPASFSYQLKSDAKAGLYQIPIVFTYFNGERWDTDRVSIEFTIRSIFQRNEHCIATVGVIAAVSTFIASLPTMWKIFQGIIDVLRGA